MLDTKPPESGAVIETDHLKQTQQSVGFGVASFGLRANYRPEHEECSCDPIPTNEAATRSRSDVTTLLEID